MANEIIQINSRLAGPSALPGYGTPGSEFHIQDSYLYLIEDHNRTINIVLDSDVESVAMEQPRMLRAGMHRIARTMTTILL